MQIPPFFLFQCVLAGAGCGLGCSVASVTVMTVLTIPVPPSARSACNSVKRIVLCSQVYLLEGMLLFWLISFLLLVRRYR